MASYIKQSTRSVEHLMRRGLPHIKLSQRATRFRRSDIDQWLADHGQTSHISSAN
jgi:hypothetical protein